MDVVVRGIGNFDAGLSGKVTIVDEMDPDRWVVVTAEVWVQASDDISIAEVERSMKERAKAALQRALDSLD
jgi:hypothetical protein